MMRSVFSFILLFLLLTCTGLAAQEADDPVKISLLTCSPGTEVYSLYGHTAVRVQDQERGLDIIFNYGVFDYRRPHFVWRFVLGQCDYEVAAIPFRLFVQEYQERGSSVFEQPLLLNRDETRRLYGNLVLNAQPQNKVYRYNFLTNNCTTKARDMIEQAVDGHVVYTEADKHSTYRQLLHHYTEDYPWSETGNDMLLGAACDTVISNRAAQFLPEQLMQYLATAQIFDEQNNRRPLVGETAILVLPGEQQPTAEHISPLMVGLIILVLLTLVALLEYKIRRMLWGVDIVLMTLQGIAGVLLCFMFFCSEHPTMDSNWQIWVFNPLPFVFLPWVVRCTRRRKVCIYHYVNALWLILFVVFSVWIPQDFPVLTLCLALALWTRPVSYLRHYGSSKCKVQSEKVKK